MTAPSNKALFIGINEYDLPDADLYACINDAEEMCRLLSAHENGDPNFTPRPIQFSKNLSNAQLKSEIENLLRPERPPEHALLYFSGHGYVNQAGGHLVGKDAKKGDIGISMEWLVEQLSTSDIPYITVILDCCYASQFAVQKPKTEAAKNTTPKKTISCLRDNVTLLAATTDLAQEGPVHGAFTKILIKGLSGAAADAFGQVTAAGLYALTDSYFSVWQQRPVIKASLTAMRPLRMCAPILDRASIRTLTSRKFFKDDTREIQLKPSDIVTVPSQETASQFLAQLLRFQRVGLITCEGQMTVYEAALQSSTCKLTPFGEFIRDMIKKERF